MKKKQNCTFDRFSSAFETAPKRKTIGSISFEMCIQNDRNHAPINFYCAYDIFCVRL